jgi:glycosyltransferase involved in cell wall biosynthesis
MASSNISPSIDHVRQSLRTHDIRRLEHVALVSDWCSPRRGGIETHILSLAKALKARGANATIITTFPGPLDIEGVEVDRIDCFRIPLLELSVSPRLVSILRQKLGSGRYSIVHIHPSIVAPLCLMALLAAHSVNLPVLVTFHSVMRTLPRFLSFLDRLSRWTNWNVTLSGVSNLVAGQLREAMPDCEIPVLANGFDRSFWSSKPSTRSGKESVHVLSTMRLQPRKRPLALIDIFSEASRIAAAQGVQLSLTIAGDGPLRDRLMRRIAENKLADRIHLAGWQRPEELRELYAESSLFVMPSVKEAFCIAALEARAAGLPVVGMAKSGIADFIQHDVSGILADNDEDMARQMAALAVDKRRLRRLANNDAGLARFDWIKLVEDHIELYRNCQRRTGG